MGNMPSRHLCSLSRDCKGRDNVVKDVRERIHDDDVDVIVICGAPMIGKSMVLIKAFLEEQKQLGADACFVYHNLDDCKEEYFQEAETFWATKIKRLVKDETNNGKGQYKILLNRLLSSNYNTVYLYLDNADVLKKWEKLAEFLELVKDSIATHDNLKVVFSTSTQVPEITNRQVVIKVPELPIEHIGSIITNVCESKNVNLNESQRLYIPLIGTLCDGIPYIAATAGSILSENEGLILPSELLELMIAQRLEVLSPTNYPTSSRFVALSGPISENSLNTEVEDYLSDITQRLKKSTFTEEEAITSSSDTRATVAMVKNFKLRPLLICCILAKDKQLRLPTVFKECKLVVDKTMAEETHGENADVVKHLEECRLNLTKENIERLNLTITDEQLEDPKEVERIIKGLTLTQKREPEENFDSFGSKILEELGLERNSLDISDEKMAESKSETTVLYGGNGYGLEFVQEQGNTFRKEEFEKYTSSKESIYDRFSHASQRHPKVHFASNIPEERTLQEVDTVSQTDMLSNGVLSVNVNSSYIATAGLEGENAGSNATHKVTTKMQTGEYAHKIDNNYKYEVQQKFMVRGETFPLLSSGPEGIGYVNPPSSGNKYNAQVSKDSGIESPE